MRNALLALALSASPMMSGCAATMLTATVSPQDAAMAETMLETTGTGTITGSALIRQSGGGVVTCAGNEVFLIPATESGSTGLRRIFGSENGYHQMGGGTLGGGEVVVAPIPNRQVLCNAQGFFTFEEVRPGRWHVMTNVVWVVGDRNQGGALLQTTDLAEGDEVDLVLSY